MKSYLIPLMSLFLVASCVVEPSVEEKSASKMSHHELGEPVGEFPSYDERVLLYLTNRLRTEPTAFNPDEPYEPSPPLKWDYALNQAARFHAQHIIEASCWCEDHSSCCTLTDSGGEVACATSASTCGGTSADERVSYWSPNYAGENMARGQMTPQAAIDGWTFSSGHWQNINRGGNSLLGAGAYNNAWVQDFGVGGQRPVAEDGIHFQDGGLVRFGINYYQPNTGGPQSILAVVNGECHELDLTYGAPELGSFETAMQLEPGCHRYYFFVRDGDGNDHVYPTTGSLGAAVATSGCELFSAERPADTCSPAGQSCETGHTRSCYTGPFGTRDVGICQSGVERCIGAQWTGECSSETLPDATDVCGDDVDNDCDGEVDEECDMVEPTPDAGTTDVDAGTSQKPTADAKPQVEPGCATSGTGGPFRYWLPVLLLGMMCAIRRQQRRS